MSKKLNVGCGKNIKEGYINLDIKQIPGIDVIHDLNKFPYPLKSNDFDEILCQDILEHVDNLLLVMNEIYRILKPNGLLKIRVPHFTSSIAFNDPTHKHFFAWDSFNYFLKSNPYNFYVDFSFEIVERKIEFGKKLAFWNWIIEPIVNLFPKLYEDTPLRIFPAMNLHFVLRKPS